jgi:HSP20 family protein
MPITRWNPMRELMNVHEQLNKVFEEDLRRNSPDLEYGNWAPAVDLREEDSQFVIQADMPGMKKEDIDVNVENNVLTVRGERRFEAEVKKENYHRIERAYGKFARSFTLPARVVTDGIAANYKDGILEVVIPKAEESKPKKIVVND